MTGSKRRQTICSGFVLQERDRHLLSELAVMRIIDREMAMVVGGFGVGRRANFRLRHLTQAGFLRRFFVGSTAHGRKAIYTLSPKGAELVSAKLGGIKRPDDRLVVGDAFVDHQMAINQVYLALKYSPQPGMRLQRWLTFRQSISQAIKLAPDAYVELASPEGIRPLFLEVDRGTEALSVWQQKTAYYLQLAVSGEFQQRFHQPQFRVLVVTNTQKRLTNVRSTIAKSTDKIFRFTTIESINREGFWSPIWLRPAGDLGQSLL
jgi:hypothetical protein